MEKTLDKTIDELVRTVGVKGVLCADAQGLCLGGKGIAKQSSSGLISNISRQAAKLCAQEMSSDDDGFKSPIVCIETDSGKILISSQGDVTVAIYKAPITS